MQALKHTPFSRCFSDVFKNFLGGSLQRPAHKFGFSFGCPRCSPNNPTIPVSKLQRVCLSIDFESIVENYWRYCRSQWLPRSSTFVDKIIRNIIWLPPEVERCIVGWVCHTLSPSVKSLLPYSEKTDLICNPDVAEREFRLHPRRHSRRLALDNANKPDAHRSGEKTCRLTKRRHRLI